MSRGEELWVLPCVHYQHSGSHSQLFLYKEADESPSVGLKENHQRTHFKSYGDTPPTSTAVIIALPSQSYRWQQCTENPHLSPLITSHSYQLNGAVAKPNPDSH
ncbi:hypothetical protein FQN60_001459 [Etheostoma spectabile]|uniref:Uncharacterized protein n=1 Tax=Etheostoma spectabile TaxID=54343 RepID=A0A5J5D6Q7_9PERO|nr:hypothetical protein FQN60_001459 [Etheostoma spectabile]